MAHWKHGLSVPSFACTHRSSASIMQLDPLERLGLRSPAGILSRSVPVFESRPSSTLHNSGLPDQLSSGFSSPATPHSPKPPSDSIDGPSYLVNSMLVHTRVLHELWQLQCPSCQTWINTSLKPSIDIGSKPGHFTVLQRHQTSRWSACRSFSPLSSRSPSIGSRYPSEAPSTPLSAFSPLEPLEGFPTSSVHELDSPTSNLTLDDLGPSPFAPLAPAFQRSLHHRSVRHLDICV